jgi:hypothetical protein
MAQARTISSRARTWTLPRSLTLDWAYAVADKRDWRLDLLRGFAVFAMVVDHLGGASWLYLVTGGNTFYVSAAEAFIFISGLVVGMVYGGIALKEGLQAAQIKALKRALTLYKLTVALTLLFAGFSLFFHLPWAQDSQIGDPLTFVLEVVALHQTMYLTDIPLMYTFLMLAAPIGLGLLVKQRTGLLVVGSSALWLGSQLFPGQVQVPWRLAGSTAFNLAAWQLLFFVAMAIGYHRETLTKKLNGLPRGSYWLFAGLLVLWLIQLHDTGGAFLTRLVPGLDAHAWLSEFFLKSTLAPGRLIASFVVFQFAYLTATLFWKPIQALLGWFLMPLGQNSLYSYTMHVAVIALLCSVLPHLPGNVTTLGTVNTSLQLLATLAIWAMIQRRFLFKIVPR